MIAPRPYVLVAELTHRCPLRCAYCSNPTAAMGGGAAELGTEAWLGVLREAEALGVVQLHLSGGEPLLRDDLEELVAAARSLELYTHLVTSGLPLSKERARRLREAGLDAVQLSFQSADPARAKRIAGVDAWDKKLRAAEWLREAGLPITLNVVLHRDNLDEVEGFIALAEELGAGRVELANTQFLGWAYVNREALLPSVAQVSAARAVAAAARVRLAGRMEVLFVTPDYVTGKPRACMGGWGQRYLIVRPDGRVLPCHAADVLPGIEWGRVGVGKAGMADIWAGEAFSKYRGEEWMLDPCRTCDQRGVDHGGCRCQAFLMTGEARAADPVCPKSPDHGVLPVAREGEGASAPLQLRVLRS